MKKSNVPWQVRVAAILFLFVVAFAVVTRQKPATTGSKVEAKDPVAGTVTSVTATAQVPTNEVRRITFTVRPRLGNGTNR